MTPRRVRYSTALASAAPARCLPMHELIIGTRIYYTGDMANASDHGMITAERPANRFAPLSYDITLDDGRTFKGVWAIAFDPGPGRRFWTDAEYEADRAKAEA